MPLCVVVLNQIEVIGPLFVISPEATIGVENAGRHGVENNAPVAPAAAVTALAATRILLFCNRRTVNVEANENSPKLLQRCLLAARALLGSTPSRFRSFSGRLLSFSIVENAPTRNSFELAHLLFMLEKRCEITNAMRTCSCID